MARIKKSEPTTTTYSSYYDQHLALDANPFTTPEGREVLIVPHSSYSDVIYNNSHSKLIQTKVDFTQLDTDPGTYAFMCTISDNTGRKVSEVGEASRASLTNDISKSYPITMAHKRAFDAAAKVYLILDRDKVYSEEDYFPKTSYEETSYETFRELLKEDVMPDLEAECSEDDTEDVMPDLEAEFLEDDYKEATPTEETPTEETPAEAIPVEEVPEEDNSATSKESSEDNLYEELLEDDKFLEDVAPQNAEDETDDDLEELLEEVTTNNTSEKLPEAASTEELLDESDEEELLEDASDETSSEELSDTDLEELLDDIESGEGGKTTEAAKPSAEAADPEMEALLKEFDNDSNGEEKEEEDEDDDDFQLPY